MTLDFEFQFLTYGILNWIAFILLVSSFVFLFLGSLGLKKDLKELSKLLVFLGIVLLIWEIISLLIEGGGEINASALKEGIVDKVMMFIAPKLIGGRTAPGPVGGTGIEHLSEAIGLHDVQVSRVGEDVLVEGYITSQAWSLR